ncbi:MAG TPA: FMN-binding negative transcriptional regulator [Gammaproteobacteria bacterium]
MTNTANYPPAYHTETDEARVYAAIEAIRHATLLVPSESGLAVAFTPFLLDRERRVLRGHVARRNPQSQLFDGRSVDAIFHGPHAYISPQLNDNDDVPTWNYVNVHVRGSATGIDDEARKWAVLVDLVQVMEKDNAAAYLHGQERRLRALLPGIVAVEIAIEKLQGRFKLGRNDPRELQAKTFSALQAETPPSLRDWLETLAPGS